MAAHSSRVKRKKDKLLSTKIRFKNKAVPDEEYDDMINIIQNRGHLVKIKGIKRSNLFQKVRRTCLTVEEDPITQKPIIKIGNVHIYTVGGSTNTVTTVFQIFHIMRYVRT